MTFEHYWSIMLKRWQLVVICFVVVGLGAFIGSKLMVPLYQSTALVQIAVQSQNNQADINSLLASDQLVQTEAQLAVSDPVLREVASHYKGMTVEYLTGVVTSTPRFNTQLFEIDVQDPNPTRAAVIATDIAMTLIKQQQQSIQRDNSNSQQQLQQDLSSTQKQIDATTAHIAALEASGGNQGKLGVLRTQLNSLQQQYSQWQTALAQLVLTQAQGGSFLRIAQYAFPSVSPVRPDVRLNTAAGFIAGLFLGVLLAIMFEFLDTRVRTAEELSQLLDWPVLATIKRASTTDKEDVINPAGHNANSESYRILRTNIGFAGIDKPLRSLMVTSASPGDGKSVIASNLAIFMAKAGKNTLLIDADLRRPTLHEKFSLQGDKMGLSNAVLALSMPAAAQSSSQQAFLSSSHHPSGSVPVSPHFSLEPYAHAVGIPNLRVMPSGPLPPNPSELLDSKAMERLFTAIEQYGAEVVVFDTPPLLGLSDTSIMASKVDGVVIVADITRANKKNLKQVKALLTQAGSRVLGCVVNKQRRSRHSKPYSYYYYYHSSDQKQQSNPGPSNGYSSNVPVDAYQPTRQSR